MPFEGWQFEPKFINFRPYSGQTSLRALMSPGLYLWYRQNDQYTILNIKNEIGKILRDEESTQLAASPWSSILSSRLLSKTFPNNQNFEIFDFSSVSKFFLENIFLEVFLIFSFP